MADSGVDFEQLKKFQKIFANAVDEVERGKVYKGAMRECGRLHLKNCVNNTPFYERYPSKTVFVTRIGGDGLPFTFPIHPKRGGTLKKGWVVKTHSVAEASPGIPSDSEINSMVQQTEVKKNGNTYEMTFFNRVKYAVWVDKGHRLCHPKGMAYGFVAPRNFVRNSENQTNGKIPKIIEKHLRKALKGKV